MYPTVGCTDDAVSGSGMAVGGSDVAAAVAIVAGGAALEREAGCAVWLLAGVSASRGTEPDECVAETGCAAPEVDAEPTEPTSAARLATAVSCGTDPDPDAKGPAVVAIARERGAHLVLRDHVKVARPGVSSILSHKAGWSECSPV